MDQKPLEILFSFDPLLGVLNWEVGTIVTPALRGRNWNLREVNQLSWTQTAIGEPALRPSSFAPGPELLTSGLLFFGNNVDV